MGASTIASSTGSSYGAGDVNKTLCGWRRPESKALDNALREWREAEQQARLNCLPVDTEVSIGTSSNLIRSSPALLPHSMGDSLLSFTPSPQQLEEEYHESFASWETGLEHSSADEVPVPMPSALSPPRGSMEGSSNRSDRWADAWWCTEWEVPFNGYDRNGELLSWDADTFVTRERKVGVQLQSNL